MSDTQVQGWTIHPESDGFQNIPNSLGGIAKYLCSKGTLMAGFAFAASLFELSMTPDITDSQLIQLSEVKMKEYLEGDLVGDRDMLTFIFENGEFREDPNAKWWVKSL